MARSLLPSYAKALIGPLVPGGGDELPDHDVEEPEVEIDPEHVAAYARVCGFGVRDTLPPTLPRTRIVYASDATSATVRT